MDEPILLAGCVLLDDYGRLLLLHRDAGDDSQWELPGGKVEEDETPEAAAIREIHEELGVVVRLKKRLGHARFETDDLYEYHWFQAEIAQGEPVITEPETFDDLDYVEIEDLPSLALSANMLELEQQLLTGEVVLDS